MIINNNKAFFRVFRVSLNIFFINTYKKKKRKMNKLIQKIKLTMYKLKRNFEKTNMRIIIN